MGVAVVDSDISDAWKKMGKRKSPLAHVFRHPAVGDSGLHNLGFYCLGSY